MASRPIGGVLSASPGRAGTSGVAIHLRGLPWDLGRAARPTFGLAPGGVYQADQVTLAAGALLPHRFTLACARRAVPSAVCSLWHFPAGRPDSPLASTLPCGAPTFLSRLRCRSTTRPRPPGRLTITEAIVARFRGLTMPAWLFAELPPPPKFLGKVYCECL